MVSGIEVEKKVENMVSNLILSWRVLPLSSLMDLILFLFLLLRVEEWKKSVLALPSNSQLIQDLNFP